MVAIFKLHTFPERHIFPLAIGIGKPNLKTRGQAKTMKK